MSAFGTKQTSPLLLLQRTERIDELANTIAVLRQQKQRLEAEADHLATLV